MNAVARAFVVDDRVRTKLADREEARAVEILMLARRATPSGDERADGETGEAVAREEAFACEVAIRVEVAFGRARRAGEEIDLRLGLLPKALRKLAVPFVAAEIADDDVLGSALLDRSNIEIAPTGARGVQ
jgi:hypothetical protein